MIIENYVAVDLEMTGLNARRDSILEIGAVRVEHKKVQAKYQAMICPHLELAEEVVQLTGITNEMARQGRELDEVFPEIMEFCGDLVLLGHNVIFDYGFLKQAAMNRNVAFERKGLDTLEAGAKTPAAGRKKTLQLLCDRFHIQRARSHRALDDAMAARELYEAFEAAYEKEQPELFAPAPLVFRTKKQSPATSRQKNHLQQLADYHHLTLQVPWETLTKNEASRQIDRIIAQYGRMPKQQVQASVSGQSL